jgi:D-alanyl-D-alanine carboxypeptidase
LTADPELVRLVDKENLLPAEYEPDDLVDLKELGLKTSRKGLRLRKEAAGALSEMSAAAKKEGIELLASSTYRSFSYQRGLYERNVKEMGREAADRESARPGSSQHQLGTALDFGSISDAFTGTPMELWLKKNAGNFGFSLSYPDGYETETGYRHESWHFRYIGKAAARMEEEFFGGIQQRLLSFLRTRITDFQRYRRN